MGIEVAEIAKLFQFGRIHSERHALHLNSILLKLDDNMVEKAVFSRDAQCIGWVVVPTGNVKNVAAMRKAIHAQEDAQAAKGKALQVALKLRAMKLARAAEIIAASVDEALSYYAMPSEH